MATMNDVVARWDKEGAPSVVLLSLVEYEHALSGYAQALNSLASNAAFEVKGLTTDGYIGHPLNLTAVADAGVRLQQAFEKCRIAGTTFLVMSGRSAERDLFVKEIQSIQATVSK